QLRQRAAREALRHPERHGRGIPPRADAGVSSRHSRPGQHPGVDVGRGSHVAGAARQVGARSALRRAAAATAAGRPAARRIDEERAGRCSSDDASADGAASQEHAVRELPPRDRSARPRARELRRHRRVPDQRQRNARRRRRRSLRRDEDERTRRPARRDPEAPGHGAAQLRREPDDVRARPPRRVRGHADDPRDHQGRGEEQQQDVELHPGRDQQSGVQDGETGNQGTRDRGAISMILTNKPLSRRTVLKAAGVTVALPVLDAMIPTRAFGAAAADKKIRVVAIEMVHGSAGSSAIGINTDVRNAEAFTAPEIGGDHFRSSAVFLTQMHPKQTQGSDVRAGTSLDQIYAQRFGQDTAIPSMQLCIENVDAAGGCSYGYSCTYTDSISWAAPDKPLPMVRDPRFVFDQLFGVGATPKERSERRDEDRSILDWLSTATGRLKSQLGAADRARLSNYLDEVREI